MNPELAKRFQEIGKQRHIDDPILIAHYFMVSGYSHWLAVEYNEQTDTCFGFAYDLDSQKEGVWCDFPLHELAKIDHPELPICDVELDVFFPEDIRFSEFCPQEFNSWKRQQELWEWENLQCSDSSLEMVR